MVIEAGKDLFTAYPLDGVGIYGVGATVKECKQDVLTCIAFAKEDPQVSVPEAVRGKDYEIAYRYDTESFLRHYKGILASEAMERLSGIDRKQLRGYASKSLRPEQLEKIQTALHGLGRELLSVELA